MKMDKGPINKSTENQKIPVQKKQTKKVPFIAHTLQKYTISHPPNKESHDAWSTKNI